MAEEADSKAGEKAAEKPAEGVPDKPAAGAAEKAEQEPAEKAEDEGGEKAAEGAPGKAEEKADGKKGGPKRIKPGVMPHLKRPVSQTFSPTLMLAIVGAIVLLIAVIAGVSVLEKGFADRDAEKTKKEAKEAPAKDVGEKP